MPLSGTGNVQVSGCFSWMVHHSPPGSASLTDITICFMDGSDRDIAAYVCEDNGVSSSICLVKSAAWSQRVSDFPSELDRKATWLWKDQTATWHLCIHDAWVGKPLKKCWFPQWNNQSEGQEGQIRWKVFAIKGFPSDQGSSQNKRWPVVAVNILI